MPKFISQFKKEDIKLTFNKEMLHLETAGCVARSFPLQWFPGLQNTSEEDRNDWDLTTTGIHWNKLDIDAHIVGFVEL